MPFHSGSRLWFYGGIMAEAACGVKPGRAQGERILTTWSSQSPPRAKATGLALPSLYETDLLALGNSLREALQY